MRPPPGPRAVRLLLAPALVAALAVLPACAKLSGSPSHQVSEWASSSGIGGLDTIVYQDLGGIFDAAKHNDLLSVHTYCAALGPEVAQPYAELPTPDTTLTDDLGHAYINLGNAATRCYDDAHPGRKAALDRDLGSLHTAEAALERAAALLTRLERPTSGG